MFPEDARPIEVFLRQGLIAAGKADDVSEGIRDGDGKRQNAAAYVQEFLDAGAALDGGMQRLAPLLELLKSVQHGVQHGVDVRRIQAQAVGAVEAEDALSLVLRRDIQHLVPHLPRTEQQTHAVDLHFPGDDLGLRREPSQPVRKDPHTQFHRVFPRISRIESNKAGASGT